MMKETKLGDALNSIRLSKNYSVKEVSFHTRIPVRFINALENNNRKELPSAVQAKGYLRILASYYEVDPQPFITAWDTNLIIIEDTPAQDQTATPTNSEISSADTQAVNKEIIEVHDGQTASQIFAAIGKQLASRRIQLGLDLVEAEGFTHIKEHNLSFLEKGGFDQIPSPVQARGMLKIYAEFLELDQAELLNFYAEGLRKKREEQLALETLPVKRKQVSFKKNNFLTGILTPDMLVVGGVVLALFIGIIWGSSYISKLKQEADIEKLGIDRGILAAEAFTFTPTPTTTPILLTETPANPNTVENLPEGQEQPTLNTSQLQLNLTAQQHVWVRIKTDTKIAFEGRLTPGNPYNFSANNSIELLTGNAGGLQVLFNNQYIGTLGKNGDVVDMLFSPSGMVTPTPMYSPTPTATEPPTLTPTFTPVVPTATVTPFIP